MTSISIYLLKILLVFHLFCISNGFSTKLIYRDSTYSPLHESNLKTFNRDIQTSRFRASNLISLTKSNVLGQNISLFFREPLFIVEIGIGTPTTKARLVFDTIAPLTWTQCKPCVNCFKQDENCPVFDPTKSRSFIRKPKNRTILSSLGCASPECHYQIATGDGLMSEGLLSMDTFSFSKEVENIVFGCGTSNADIRDHYTRMMITGVLGMGNYATSLPNQLGDHIMHRFSYCIPTLRSNETRKTDLTFGKAASFTKANNVQTTHFLPQLDGPILRKSSYRLKLQGISIARKRLTIPQGSFTEGIIIDTGSPFSMINKKAYNVVVKAISNFFSQWKNIKQVAYKKYPGRACYKYPNGFRNFPSMILHFDGADLEINGTSLFMFGRGGLFRSNFICLQMLEGRPDILGVYQQQNVRFLYDLGRKKLSFAREDC